MAFHAKGGEKTLTASGSGTISFDISAGRRFNVAKISVVSTGDFKITKIEDTARSEQFLTGNLYKGHFLEGESYLLDLSKIVPLDITGASKLVFTLTDTSAAENAVKLVLYGDEAGG